MVEDGIPETCDNVPIEEVTALDFDSPLQVFNGCRDRLVAELYNGTVKIVPPSIIGLKSCVKKEDNKTSEDNLIIHKYRKCCPRGQSYDSNFHLCRESAVNNSEEWLLKRLKMNDNDIYEVNTGLDCAADEYGLELRQRFFSLQTEGSTLKIFSKKRDGSGDADEGQWCVDREFSSSELVARVCSSDCSKYGAFCVRKCCPIGYHYKLQPCGQTFDGKCVLNDDDIGREDTPRGQHCKDCPEDTAEHTVAVCPARAEHRRVLRDLVDDSDLSRPVLAKAMVRSEGDWDAVSSFCEAVMLDKEEAGRPSRETHRASGIARRSPATLSAGLRTASKGSLPLDQNQTRASVASRNACASKSHQITTTDGAHMG
uniref:SFRICE_035180 n=1 Tax=Spodoptera frugiperda TaxID=7108 RepID=A0A2H1WT15_SPOFR